MIRAAEKQGRSGEDITLVAVSKTVSVEKIKFAIENGIRHIGENRIQEAREKIPMIEDRVTWHMVGHLQKNKVKYAVKFFDLIQSVDNLALAEVIDKRCELENRRMPILIEVNTSGEPTKFGCAPEASLSLLKQIALLPNLLIKGFMTIGIFSSDPAAVRLCFRRLREIYEEARTLNLPGTDISILSMGMTHDFEVAIEEGANMVRIGTAIFGPRDV